jgi:hypothetical protein
VFHKGYEPDRKQVAHDFSQCVSVVRTLHIRSMLAVSQRWLSEQVEWKARKVKAWQRVGG